MSTLSVSTYVAALFNRVVLLCEKYPDAVYSPNDSIEDYDAGFVECGPPECGCLIGQANRMLKEYEQIELVEGLDIVGCIKKAYGDANKNPETINQMNMIVSIQKLQDKRVPWGSCLMMVR